jgi:hypothetical protein
MVQIFPIEESTTRRLVEGYAVGHYSRITFNSQGQTLLVLHSHFFAQNTVYYSMPVRLGSSHHVLLGFEQSIRFLSILPSCWLSAESAGNGGNNTVGIGPRYADSAASANQKGRIPLRNPPQFDMYQILFHL